jgi:hypothetical protein
MFLESESNKTILLTHVLDEMLHSVQKCTTVKPHYNISLCDISSTASGILWYQFIPVNNDIILLG